MCGIAGIVHTDPGHPVSAELLRRMTTAMTHRGPDADGFHLGRGVGIGHRRLSIIDLVHRRPAHVQRGRDGRGRVQRRDLQLPGAARRARRARPPVRNPVGHRGDRARLRGARARLGGPAPGHVRDRPVGRPEPPAAPRPRPRGEEAALLRARRRPPRLRLRAEGAAPGRGPQARGGGGRPRRLPVLRLRARARDHPPGGRADPARPLPRLGARTDPPHRVLGRAPRPASRADGSAGARGVLGGLHRRGARSPHQRRAPGGLPLGRRRLDGGGGGDGAPVRPPRAHHRGRLHRAPLERAAPRARGRPGPRHRPPRGARGGAGRRDPAASGLAPRRAVRRFLRAAHLLRRQGGAGAGHGRALGRRGRRDLRGLSAAVRAESLGVALPPALARLGAARRAGPAGPDLPQGGLAAAPAARPVLPAESRDHASSAPTSATCPFCARPTSAALISPELRRELAGHDPFTGFARHFDRVAQPRPAEPASLRRLQDLARQRHPGEGGPDEHGLVAGGARAPARPPGGRVRRLGVPGLEVPRSHLEVPPQAPSRRPGACLRGAPAQAGLRDPPRRLAAGRAHGHGARPAAVAPSAGPGLRATRPPSARCGSGISGAAATMPRRSGRSSCSSCGTAPSSTGRPADDSGFPPSSRSGARASSASPAPSTTSRASRAGRTRACGGGWRRSPPSCPTWACRSARASWSWAAAAAPTCACSAGSGIAPWGSTTRCRASSARWPPIPAARAAISRARPMRCRSGRRRSTSWSRSACSRPCRSPRGHWRRCGA